MRRAALAAGLLMLLPGAAAAAEPVVPDANLQASILPISPEVQSISPEVRDLAGAVLPLEEEKTDGAKTLIRISSDVLFDFNKATLTSPAVAHLATLAKRLHGGNVQVAGFSDSVGTTQYNLRLSRQRADAVRAELRRLGITGVTAKGYGEARPVEPNEINKKDNPAGRAKNRRVELTFRGS
jgi:outer membrane protein OmpA-like peptidoglycan-associated protein